jgi:Peptidase family M28
MRFGTAPALLLLGIVNLHAQTAPLLRAHVEFLASDHMQGRPCPSLSCQLTADYILAHFRAAGLETQVQTTGNIAEIRRGDVTVRPSALPIKGMLLNAPGKIDDQGTRLTTRAGALERSAELDPIFEATGPITVSSVPEGMRNVIGVLPGRDPALKDTYVLVTAHYDHVGTNPEGDVFNGANDNASGVAALIEIARAIRSAPVQPRRSIAFIAYFGEEQGMVGSRYYAQSPVFPLEKTYAQVNFEQLGRTDDTEGARVRAATVTGWDRSDVGKALAAAAAPFGIRIYKHEKFSDLFFERSDNEALAKRGVPAHTISVAYGYPDYHAPGDDAGKLDYANMARVTRALRAGVVRIANRRARLILREESPAASAPASGSSPATPSPKRSKPSPKPPKD